MGAGSVPGKPCVQREVSSMPAKPSLETQGEKAGGHRRAGKEAQNQPVASAPIDTSLMGRAHGWGPGASALDSS